MKLTILALLVTCASSQSLLRSPAQARNPFAQSLPYGMSRAANTREYIKAFAGERDYKPLSGVETSSQYNMDRRTAASLLTAGVLSAPALSNAAPAKSGSDIKLVTFDGAPGTSDRPWSISPALEKIAYDKGELKIGGFVTDPRAVGDKITAWTLETFSFPDISSCEGMSFTAKSKTPYTGFAMSIGVNKASGGGTSYAYKAKFDAPVGEFGTVQIPFSSFTSRPSKKTGESKKLSGSDPLLQDIGRVSFWGETKGEVAFEVKEVSAYGCKAVAEEDLAATDTESDASVLYLAAAPLGLLVVFFVMRSRTRAAPIAPPLLG